MGTRRSTPLTGENTNAWGHRVTGDTLVYQCPDCEFGEVPVVDMIEEDSGRCLDCGSRFRLTAEAVEEAADAQ